MPNSLKRRKQREAQRLQVSQTIQQRIEFSGPIPPPPILKQYEEIIPGAGERILAMAEKEQNHRHGREKTADTFDILLSRLGMFCAFIITMASLASATWLAILGHEITGGTVGACGIGLIVAKFLHGSIKGK